MRDLEKKVADEDGHAILDLLTLPIAFSLPKQQYISSTKNYARRQFLGFRSTLACQISPTADLLVLVFIFSVTDDSDKVQTSKEKEARHERSWSRPRNNQPKVNLEVNPALC